MLKNLSGKEWVEGTQKGDAKYKITTAQIAALAQGGSPSLAGYLTRLVAAAAIITAPVQSLTTGGFAAAGDGGAAQYVRVGSAQVGGFQSADGAFWAYAPNGTLKIEQFGGKADYNPVNGTWSTDNSPAIALAIATVTVNFVPTFAFYSGGPTIEFLYGSYYFSQSIAPNKTISLEGKGPGVNGGAGTALFFAKDRDGILLNNFTSGPTTPGTAGSTVRGMSINALAGGVVGHGINAQSRSYLYDLVIIGFTGGSGVNLDSTLTVGGNVDGWVSSNLRIVRCNNGHVAIGSDANAGNAYGLDIASCTVSGISDQSFLGNNYWGCQVSACGTYAYEATNPNAQTMFYGCYVEGGQVCNVNSPAIIWGGFLAFNAVHVGNAIRINNGSIQQLGIVGSLAFTRTGYTTIINPTFGGLASLLATGESQPWQFPILSGGNWGIARPGKSGLIMTTIFNTTALSGSPVPVAPGNFWFGAGLYLGSASGSFPLARLLDFDTAAPTTGLQNRGNTRLNNTPVAGGNVGWGTLTTGAVATVAWAAATAYVVGALVLNDGGKTYICTTAGVSAGAGGPTGNGTGIADGTCVWSFQAAFTTAPWGNYILEATQAYAGETIGIGGVGAVFTLAMPGAALGDLVDASVNLDQQGLVLNSWISAANVTKYQFVNPAGAAGGVTLAAGTVKVRVRK